MAEPTAAQTDLRVLVDVSGSMQKNDPENLRRDALRLLIGLVPEDARVGIWSFAQYVNMQVKPDFPTKQWKKNARKEANKIHSRGMFTNIEDTLSKSTWDWKRPDPKWNRHLILLTDGMVDIARQANKNTASRKRILENILPQLKAAGVKVHTIALSSNADHALMKSLAESTDGWYKSVNSADKLKRVFLHLFEKSTPTDSVPLQGNRFEVDKSIEDMTMLVFRSKNAEPTSIVRPDNTAFQYGQIPKNVEWYHDTGFDLITVHKPQQGEWRINAAIDPDNRVKIVTNLKLRVQNLPNNVHKGEAIKLVAGLYEDNKLMHEKDLLSLVDMHLSGQYTDASSAYDKGMDKTATVGEYSADFSGLSKTGEVNLLLTATGPTFRREYRHNFRVLDSPVVLEVEGIETGYSISVIENELLQPGTLQLALRFAGDGTAYHIPKYGAHRWRAVIDKAYAGQKFIVQAKAVLLGNKVFTTQLTGTLPEPVIEDFEPLSFEVMENSTGFTVLAKVKPGRLQTGTLRGEINTGATNESNIVLHSVGLYQWQANVGGENAETVLPITIQAHELNGKPYTKTYEITLPALTLAKEDSSSGEITEAQIDDKTAADEPEQSQSEEVIEEHDAKKSSLNWLIISLSILVINILLAIGGYYGYRYWKKTQSPLSDDFDSEGDVIDAISESFESPRETSDSDAITANVTEESVADTGEVGEDFEALRSPPEPIEPVDLSADDGSSQKSSVEDASTLSDMLNENKPDDLPELDDILDDDLGETVKVNEGDDKGGIETAEASSDEDLDDAWGAALEESGDRPKQEDEQPATEQGAEASSDEDLDDAWGAALEESGDRPKQEGEQPATEQNAEASSDEDLDDAWGAALEESGDRPKQEEVEAATDEAAEASSDEDLADAWGAAFEESGDTLSEDKGTDDTKVKNNE